MSGMGRGRSLYGRARRGVKLPITCLPGLNIPKLVKTIKKSPGSYSMLAGKVTISLSESCIKFEHADQSLLPIEKIDLSALPCNYGGFRYFGHCPSCQKRVSTLYLLGNSLECRKCLSLCYWSQNMTLRDRLYRKEKKLKDRIGKEQSIKPKWMREKSFQRLLNELFDTEERGDVADFFRSKSIWEVDCILKKHGDALSAAEAWGRNFLQKPRNKKQLNRSKKKH